MKKGETWETASKASELGVEKSELLILLTRYLCNYPSVPSPTSIAYPC